MNQNDSFRRKVIYIVAIAVLLIPLSYISQPAAGTGEDTSGGVLAQLRAKHDLAQAELGEIDPAGESMKLASLGMKGVAVLVLWEKAIEAKKKQDWDTLSATLNQITKLQPHYVKVWEFQAHNLAYNVSVEFDDFKHRYHWVKKGIDFLMGGTAYNQNEPKLLWGVGWFLGHKIGRSDERRLFRELFRDDEEFHMTIGSYDGIDMEEAIDLRREYDNWHTARLWFNKAYSWLDTQRGSRIIIDRDIYKQRTKVFEKDEKMGNGPAIYFADGPMTYINWALDDSEENEPDPVKTQLAWSRAKDSYTYYGKRQIMTSFGTLIRLDSEQVIKEQGEGKTQQVKDLLADAAEERRQEIIETFPDEIKAVFNKDKEDRSEEEQGIFEEWDQRTVMEDEQFLIRRVSEDKLPELERRLRERAEIYERLNLVQSYRRMTNYEFWENRCAAEASEECIEARTSLYHANKLYADARLYRSERLDENNKRVYKVIYEEDENGKIVPVPIRDEKGNKVVEMVDGAREVYEQAWTQWASVVEKYPTMECRTVAGELAPHIAQYINVLQNVGEEALMAEFKLMGMLEWLRGEEGMPTPEDLAEQYGKKKSDELASAKDETDKAKPANETSSESNHPDSDTENEKPKKDTTQEPMADTDSKKSVNKDAEVGLEGPRKTPLKFRRKTKEEKK